MAPLAWQPIDLPLGSGMDDNTSKAALPPGKPVLLTNAYFGSDGALAKRLGFDMQYDGTLGSTSGLISAGLRLVALAAQKLYDYSKSANVFESRGTARAVPTSSTVLKSSSVDITGCDVCSLSGFTMLAWCESSLANTVHVQVTDDTTGAVVSTKDIVFSSGTNPYIQVAGFIDATSHPNFFVLRGGQLLRATYNGSTFTWDGSITTVLSGSWNASRIYVDQANSKLYVGMVGSAFLGFANLNAASLAVNASGTHAVSSSGNVMALGYNSGAFYIAYQDQTSGVVAWSGTTSSGSFVSSATIDSAIVAGHMAFGLNGSTLALYYDDSTRVGTLQSLIYQCQLLPSQGSPSVFMRSVSLASDVIYSGGVGYLQVIYSSQVTGASSTAVAQQFPALSSMATLNAASFIVDTSGNICARTLRAAALTQPTVSSATASSSGPVFSCRTLSLAESPTIQAALSLGSAAVVRFNLSSEKGRGVVANRDLLICGGSPLSYDGTTPAEANFHVYPEAVTSLAPSVAGDFNTTPIARSTKFTLGQMMQFTDAGTGATSGLLWMCVVGGKTASSQPSYTLTIGAQVTDGTAVFKAVGYTSPRSWATNLLVSVGLMMVPSVLNGYEYEVTAINTVSNPTGSTGTTEPTWPTTIGSNVVQNFITYTCRQAQRTQLTASKGYTYQYCYAWVDDQGQLQRSAASIPAGITMPATGSNPLTQNPMLAVTPMRVSAKPNVRIEVYRTAGDGTVCQQISNLANDATVAAIAFMDTTPDTTQALGAVLYQGSLGAGAYENRPPPSCTTLATFGRRVWANSLESPYSAFPSQLITDGYAPSWADELEVPLNANLGTFQGGAMAMDGALFLFQDNGISMLAGDGVDNTGAGTPFGQPIELPVDVGCSNPDSLVLAPVGIFFQSRRGIYLLDRNRQTQFVGESIRNHLTGTVVAAEVDPVTHQVVFVAGGSLYTYDYQKGAWAVWTLANSIQAANLVAWNGTLVIADSGGNILAQSGAHYYDSGTLYGFGPCEFAPVRLAGTVQGYAHVRSANLLIKSSGSAVTVGVKHDYSDSLAYTLSALTLASGRDSIQANFRTQKLASVGLVITEATPTDGAFVLEGIQFEVGIKGGLERRAKAKRAG